jgi:hypothetical protein
VAYRFSQKFQAIVEQEQDDNFISRLHGGKLDIIPWPAIESTDSYKLFGVLKRRLDLQKISHPTAGAFLHTIKTLMAKIKVFHRISLITSFFSVSTYRQMTGGRFLVCNFVFLFDLQIYPCYRDDDRASCEVTVGSPTNRACHWICEDRASD